MSTTRFRPGGTGSLTSALAAAGQQTGGTPTAASEEWSSTSNTDKTISTD